MIKEAWKNLIDFVQDINTTSARILLSLFLAGIMVLSTLVMMFLQLKIDIAVLGALCAFIVSMGGLDVIQYTQKRKSYVPESNGTPDAAATVANRVAGSEHNVEFTP